MQKHNFKKGFLFFLLMLFIICFSKSGLDSCLPDSSGAAGEEADLPGGRGGDGEDHHDWQEGEDWDKEGGGSAQWQEGGPHVILDFIKKKGKLHLFFSKYKWPSDWQGVEIFWIKFINTEIKLFNITIPFELLLTTTLLT